MAHFFRICLVNLIFLPYCHVTTASAAAEKNLLQLSYGKEEEKILSLLDKEVDIEEQDFNGRRALHLNAIHNNFTALEKLLEKKACIDSLDMFGRTPLMWAAINGHQKSAEILIKAGANYRLKDHEKRTALTLAAIHGHDTIVRMINREKAKIPRAAP